MRKARNLSLGIAALMAMAGVAAAAAPQTPSSPAGRYVRKEFSNGDILLVREGKLWRITIGAAGLPRGGATAADCGLVAVGPLKNGRIVGRLIPSPDTAYDRVVEGQAPGTITLVVRKRSVFVEEKNASSQHCGMGSHLGGTYLKR